MHHYCKAESAYDDWKDEKITLRQFENEGGFHRYRVNLSRHIGDIPGENTPHAGWCATPSNSVPDGNPFLLIGQRPGDFMQTYTGRAFWPLDPRQDEVFIEDIAHSLSMQCRYAGHCIKFYSVAEHSVLIARWLLDSFRPEVALWGLLHDAPEAYVVDVPRPLKPYLDNYKRIEDGVMATIAKRYGLSGKMPDPVHEADGRIIADELVNLAPMPWHQKHDNPLGVTLEYWEPAKAKDEYLAAFDALLEMAGI